MLSDHEQRRLAEIELLLSGDDPGFVQRFAARSADGRRRRRRLIAAVVAICGAIAAIVGLTLPPNVAIVVPAMCLIGVAGGIYTYRPRKAR
jgi:uncharacterized membrane protein